ncbi:MAG: hypothetical protein WCK55_14585 [Verrucomicrobiota bacterium]
MKLEDVTAQLRPRGSWEAVDLGFALTRRHFPLLLSSWALTVVPLWALLLLTSRWVPMGWVLLAIWWLKPVYDRVPLFILSRSLFGATPKLRDLLRAWPGMLVRRLPWLLVARAPWWIAGPAFSWARPLLLPAIDLEGQRGSAWKARRTVLLRQAGGTALSLLMLCGIYETILVFALLTLGSQLAADPLGAFELGDAFVEAVFRHGQMSPWLEWCLIGGYLAAMTLVELFYVGGGFGLYLNSRTTLEGWDVELAFRRLARRLGKAAAILTAVLLPLCCTASARAADTKPATQLSPEAQAISDVLAHEDFKVHEHETGSWEPDGSEPKPGVNAAGWFEALGSVLFYAVITGLCVLLAWLIWKNREFFTRGERAGKAAPVGPRTLMGMNVAPDSLPDDIAAAARARWDAGDARGAMSLLYRGALSWLIHAARAPVRDGDTEGDCLRHASAITEQVRREYFAVLTRQWVTVAYAERAPAAREFERLLGSWPFAGGGQR